MSNDILVYVEHLNGEVTDATYELLATARSLAAQTGGSVDAAVIGSGTGNLAAALGGADRILVAETDALGAFNPQGHAALFSDIVATRQPALTLVPYTSVGMEIGNQVSASSGLPLVSYCLSVDASDGLKATCQLYSGKVEADVEVDGERAVFAMLAGAASADEGRAGGTASVEAVDAAVPDLAVSFIGLAEPEGGDVDITAGEVLVAIGRGIESEDNIEEARELADALGAPLAASRPIIDQGWLPKTRQVGKSGLTVKPKVYLALGISGAPEHLEGMRDSATIIAVNSDPQAPIFGVAHYGWVGDIFDFIPELTDRLDG